MTEHSERYWEARWRDEKAHNDALVKALAAEAIQTAVGAAIANQIPVHNPAQAWDAGHSWLGRLIFKNRYGEFRR